jgi:hypothetical protein
MANTTDDRAVSQACLQLQAIRELVAVYQTVHEKGDDDSEALEEIYGNALSVSVRSDWQTAGSRLEPGEYQILLSTGGPACRIVGDLDGDEPTTARLEHQDWFTPWQELSTSAAEQEALIDYARFFSFGS